MLTEDQYHDQENISDQRSGFPVWPSLHSNPTIHTAKTKDRLLLQLQKFDA